jgi:hypothetical protein
MASAETNISEQKKEIIKNLYDSGIPEDFIALQLDLEISLVIDILKELETYEGEHRAG